MNCKQGDLAIIIYSPVSKEHIGKIIECINIGIIDTNGYSWNTKPDLFRKDGRRIMWCDVDLRPIRDSDKQDEMLSIVNLKEKVKS